jgi:serpin B
MMHVKDHFKYYSDEKWQAIELPYKGHDISMLVLLPKETNSIELNTITPNLVNNIMSKLDSTEVDLFFPKFKMAWGTFSLKQALLEMGIQNAFSNADFSGINGKKDLFLSDVLHKAVIEVNEEGTEASAATGGAIELSIEGELTVFCADHPFVFLIKDNKTGSILFMGRVMNPSE